MSGIHCSSVQSSRNSPIAVQHFAFIDALRGYAILAVLAMHVGVSTPGLFSVAASFTLLGATGVQLFFVISAFTLFWSQQTRSQTDGQSTLAFFARRFFRIAPLFWVGIAFYSVFPDVWRANVAPDGVGWPHVIATIFFVHGWSPTTINTIVPGGWSIGAEVMFYLCVPFLFRRIKTLDDAIRLTIRATLFSMVYFFIGLTVLDAFGPPSWSPIAGTFLLFTFPSQFPVFCCGIVLYFVVKARSDSVSGVKERDSIYLLLPRYAGWIVLVGVLLALRIVPSHIMSAGAFVLIAWAMSLRTFPWLTNSIIRFIGKISYSAYIWHFWMLHHLGPLVVAHLHVSQDATLNAMAVYFAMYAVVLLATIAVATASFYVIEQPAQRFGSRWIKRMGWGETKPARERAVVVREVDRAFSAIPAT